MPAPMHRVKPRRTGIHCPWGSRTVQVYIQFKFEIIAQKLHEKQGTCKKREITKTIGWIKVFVQTKIKGDKPPF